MFKLTATPTFTAPVTAQIPGDRGRTTKVMFTVRFKRLSQGEYQAVLRRLQESKAAMVAAGDAVPKFGDRELIDEVLAGFEPDLLDENDQPLPFTPENVDALCAIYPIQPAIVSAFFEHFGRAAEKK